MDQALTIQDRALNPSQPLPEAIEAALMEGDFMKLAPAHRVVYYRAMCDSLGLNWMTRPFDFIKGEDGKYRPYARKEACEQLRKMHRVSLKTVERAWLDDDLYMVIVEATLPDGRTEQAQGIVSVGKAQGQARANTLMKAETKAKRRVTLAICGLGWSMLDDEPGRGQVSHFNPNTGLGDGETLALVEGDMVDTETGEVQDDSEPMLDETDLEPTTATLEGQVISLCEEYGIDYAALMERVCKKVGVDNLMALERRHWQAVVDSLKDEAIRGKLLGEMQGEDTA